jgi:hypothetical protein
MELPFLTEGSQPIPGTQVTLSGLGGRRGAPWQACYTMDERLEFVARLLDDGELERGPASTASRPPAIECYDSLG